MCCFFLFLAAFFFLLLIVSLFLLFFSLCCLLPGFFCIHIPQVWKSYQSLYLLLLTRRFLSLHILYLTPNKKHCNLPNPFSNNLHSTWFCSSDNGFYLL